MPDYPIRKALRLSGYDYSTPGYYFVTVCTAVRHKNVLAAIPPVGGGLCAAPSPFLTPIGELVAASIQKIPILNPGASVDASCIMPDHIHLIVALTAGRDGARPLQDILGRMKSYTDHQYRVMGMPFGPKLWQEGYYDHIIRTAADLDETRRYILGNPARSQLTE